MSAIDQLDRRKRLSITFVCGAAASATALVVCIISFVSLYAFERNLLQSVALRGQKTNFEIAQETFSNLYNQGNWIHLEDFKNSFLKESDVVYSYVVDQKGDILLGPDGYRSKYSGLRELPWEPKGLEITPQPKHIEITATDPKLLEQFPKLKYNSRLVLLTFPMICSGAKEPCGERRHLVTFNSIEAALNNLSLLFFLIGIGLTLSIGASVWWIVHRLLKPLRSLSKELKLISSPERIESTTTLTSGDFSKHFLNSQTGEVADLQQSIYNFARHQDNLHQLREQADVSKALSKLATQVLHDIRSPLAVLEGWSRNIVGIREQDRKILMGVVRRVRDIANSLTKVKRIQTHGHFPTEAEESETCFLVALLEDIVAEKLVEFRDHTNLSFTIHADLKSDTSLCVRGEPDELKRIISNILNNSVEAIGTNSGDIEIGLASSTQSLVEFYVRDTGKGIPAHIIPRLMTEGVTHDKPDGSGLGLFKAREVVKGFDGDIRIDSKVGVGTTVFISLPRRLAPSYVINKLVLAKEFTAVLLDDDQDVHDSWRKRLTEVGFAPEKIISTYSGKDFATALEKLENVSNAIFLVDHDLVGSPENGLDLIKRLGIQSRSILVTNRYDDLMILGQIKSLRCSLLPKSHISKLPIEIIAPPLGSPVIALVDDEDFFRSYWRTILTGKSRAFFDFSTREGILEYRFVLPKDALLFIDVNIASVGDGLILAQELYDLCFTHIYLCTGHDASEIKVAPFVKEVISKELPDWLLGST